MTSQGRKRSAGLLERPLWVLHRFQAMEPGEVRYRIGRTAAAAYDRLRARVGGSGDTAVALVTAPPRRKAAFEQGDQLRNLFVERFPDAVSALTAEADALCQGRLRLFGTREIVLNGNGAQRRGRRSPWLSDASLGGVGDPRRIAWEISRHQHWPRLALAYLLTRDARYVDELEHQVQQWRAKNPSGRGVNWQSAMEAAIRAQNWAWTMRVLAWSGHADDPVTRQLWRLLPAHLAFVASRRSRYSSANNHLLVEAAGLAVLGQELPELPRSQEVREQGLAILTDELPRQVFPDGCSVEQAFRYHTFVLEQLLLLIAAGGELPDAIPLVAGRMAEFVADFVSDGDVPTVGDSDDGRIVRLTASGMDDGELVGLAAQLLDRPDLAHHGSWGESAFWITGGEEPAISAPPSSRATTSHYPDGGYTLIRSSDSRKRILLDHGPLGLGRLAAHGHADCLSVLIWLDGKPLLLDSGSYLYGAAAYRDLFRSTRAHNTVAVADRDQSEMLGPFLWGKKAAGQLLGALFRDDLDVVEATHDGYQPRSHRRAVLRVGDDLVIVSDAVSSPDPCSAVASFLFGPRWKIQSDAGGIWVEDAFRLTPVLPAAASWGLESVPVASGFARLSTARALRFQVPVAGEVVFHTVIAFDDAAAAVTVQSGWLHVRHPSGRVSVALGLADDGSLRFAGGSAFLSRHPDGSVDWIVGRDVDVLTCRGEDWRDRAVPLTKTPQL